MMSTKGSLVEIRSHMNGFADLVENKLRLSATSSSWRRFSKESMRTTSSESDVARGLERHVAMGEIQIVPPVHIPIPTKIGSKMGGAQKTRKV